VEVIAEPKRAKEIAVEETRRVLEVLMYGIMLPCDFQDVQGGFELPDACN
jgi:hypothetical protein